MGTLNANALRGRVCEVVETLSHSKVDVCCIEETLYRGGNTLSRARTPGTSSAGLEMTKALLV